MADEVTDERADRFRAAMIAVGEALEAAQQAYTEVVDVMAEMFDADGGDFEPAPEFP